MAATQYCVYVARKNVTCSRRGADSEREAEWKRQKQFGKTNTRGAKKYATAFGGQDQQLSRRQITHCGRDFHNNNKRQQQG